MAKEPGIKQIRNSILILKSNPVTLQSAEVFLNSRGWDVYSTIHLEDVIKLVLTKNPQYLLLCASHPEKKVRSLPKILVQAVNIKIILYVDVASTINISLMNSIGISNYILPPVSGPAVERAIFKLEKDETLRKVDKQRYQKESLSHYAINGRESSIPEIEIKLEQILNKIEEVEEGLNDVDSSSIEARTKSAKTGQTEKIETFADYEERKRNERKAKIQEESSYNVYLKEKAEMRGVSPSFIDYAKPQQSNSGRLNSIIVKGTQHALDLSVKHNPDKTRIEKLEKSQNCICIIIDSTRFRGYLIAALGQNRRFDDEFVINVQSKLYDFLKAQGEKLDEDGALEIKIKTVEFEDWALEQAEFLKKSIHNGDEVAMAFFPSKKTNLDLEQSVREDMLQLSIDDLMGDLHVLFDVYIYLPANKKYILYTPKGGIFLANQKDRLKNKGIFHMHMKKEDIDSAKKYNVQNYLNNKIEEFNSNRLSLEKKNRIS